MKVVISFMEYQILVFLLGLLTGWYFGMKRGIKSTKELMRYVMTVLELEKLPPPKDSILKRIWKFITKKWKVSKFLRKALYWVTALFIGFAIAVLFTGCTAELARNIAGVEEDRFIVKFPTNDPQVKVVYLEGKVRMDWVEDLKKAFEDKNSVGVVAVVESGGGGVIEAKLVHHAILNLRQKHDKPLFVFTERGMYSGAYWVFLCADHISVSPSTMMGSIGVFSVRMDYTKADSMAGVKYHLFKSGECKAAWFIHDTLTSVQRMILQTQVDYIYLEFLQTILSYRRVQLERGLETYDSVLHVDNVEDYLKTICDGRAYFAVEAYNFGLIDGVYYFDQFKDFVRSRCKKEIEFTDLDGKEVGDYLVYKETEEEQKKDRKNPDHPYTIYVGY